MSGFKRLIKNSVANIINGFSNVIMGIIISPFLLSTLSIDEFSIWSLMLQVGAFFSLLGFGSQVAVSRYITIAKTNKNCSEEYKTIKNGLRLCLISIFIAIIILLLVCFSFKSIFNEIDYEEIKNVELSFFLVSLSFIFGLVPSIFFGYFMGIERNDIPATINLISRIIIGAGIIISSAHGIFYMSCLYFLLNSISYICIYLVYKKKTTFTKDYSKHNQPTFREFISYCFGISVFNFSMFLITGLNSILVGKYAFKEFAFYSLAMTLTSTAIGFLAAGLTPILQPLIKSSQNNEDKNISNIVYCLTIIILLIIIITISIIPFIGYPILTLWLGHNISDNTYDIFLCLLSVSLIRMIGAPLSLLYIAKAKQNEIMYIPFIEGVISVLLTIFLIQHYGMYAVPISMACAIIIILFIYYFRLLKILTINPYQNKFKLIFLLTPPILVGMVYISFYKHLVNYDTALIKIITIMTSLFILNELKKKVLELRNYLRNQ
ncbi:lipopolysaccharide biosynthesis protein [Xenorhabdus lircayensis]|uniref:Lipopolysaccharide biosynthesis protein n=1 Tax=Xenorhabdus lircayensis TaxID=2763499 RepID=A0ABS0U3G5_9GAMM|nr:oligosaccharide flippase family protein [Xenorhabdus lircayensis]MBI6548019.1 lipopolysaccharide biosynthesis protein [Xenorhabdus lircayensis]